MKKNFPVTPNQLVLRDDAMLVSKTDLKGRITFVNHDFVEASGYSERELVGQSHNIVRHPEMPPAAFEDMWQRLRDGRPWSGLVKNRCKNGDYYWVEANVSPIRQGDEVTGFLSVRYKPDARQVALAERALVSGGMLPGYTQHRAGRLSARLNKVSLGQRMLGHDGLLLLSGAAVAAAGSLGQMALVVASAVLATGAIWASLRLRRDTLAVLATATGSLDAMAQGNYRTDFALRHGIGEELLDALKSTQTRLGFELAEVRRVAEEGQRLRHSLDHVSTGVMICNKERQIVYVNQSVQETLRKAEASIRSQVPSFDAEQLIGQNIDMFHRQPAHQAQILDNLQQAHSAQLKLGGRTLRVIANPVFDDRGQRIGAAAEWTDLTDELAMLATERLLATENTRVRAALDNGSMAVMIADNENSIIYVNRALVAMFETAQADIRRKVPQFDAQHLIGTQTDQFIGGSSSRTGASTQVLDGTNQSFRTTLKFGGHTFALTVNTVIDDRGERLGSVMEWVDRTAELAAEKEVMRVVQEAGVGNLTERAHLELMPAGFLRDAGAGINRVLDAVTAPISDVVRVLEALADGDLRQRITADYQGTFAKLRDDANASFNVLGDSIRQIIQSAEAIRQAADEISVGNLDLSRRTEQQAASLAETASSMEQLSSTVRQNAEHARQANEKTGEASVIAERGGDAVGRVVTTMAAINDSSKKIVDIIGVIDGIAFQTNILALNAAVEAARAGEQGRGFAVVAAEVRSLAQRSASAAKEIKGLIGESVANVEGGARQVSDAGRTMTEIVGSVRQVTGIMAEIASASTAQGTGIEQVNRAVAQLDDVTQQNAALVEQAAAAAESLKTQASALAEAVNYFRLDLEPVEARFDHHSLRSRHARPHYAVHRMLTDTSWERAGS